MQHVQLRRVCCRQGERGEFPFCPHSNGWRTLTRSLAVLGLSRRIMEREHHRIPRELHRLRHWEVLRCSWRHHGGDMRELCGGQILR